MTHCLNCGNETKNNYCSVCGQSNSTHRFSLKHFFLHDFLHGVFHLDKGFLFTLKELFSRPGHSIREYIQGKRADHFNYFTLIIIIIATAHFLGKIPKVSLADIMEASSGVRGRVKVLKEYGKIATLASIPIYAAASYLVFHKSRQNYTEHLIMAMYFTSVILIFHTIPLIVVLFTQNINYINLTTAIVLLLEYSYYFWFFYQYFSTFNYTKKGLTIRSFGAVFALLAASSFVNYTLNIIGNHYLK